MRLIVSETDSAETKLYIYKNDHVPLIPTPKQLDMIIGAVKVLITLDNLTRIILSFFGSYLVWRD